MKPWYTLTAEQVARELDVDLRRGLRDQQWHDRLAQYGPNELPEGGGRSLVRILWEQLSGAMVIMLLVAAVVSYFLGEYTDAVVILVIVVLNALLGLVQDYKAERALAALKEMAVPHVRVRRDGHLCDVSARELVPGDIVMLEAGSRVPADCRLVELASLKVQESALTGESEPVAKRVDPLSDPALPVADQANMVFMGTTVTYGHGIGVVVATGLQTQLGQIAHSLQSVQVEPTPLQRRLAQLGRALALVAILIVLIVVAFGWLQGASFRLMVMTGLSMAVALVPEGLPAVATVALALGARRMLQRNALIRKLPAVETLGSVTVICSDKTGTLTHNRMTVTVIDIAGDTIEVGTDSWHSDADPELIQRAAQHPAISLLLAGAALCNDAQLDFEPEQRRYRAFGDPTEAALAVIAARLGFAPNDLAEVLPRTSEVPFDSDRKRMTTFHRLPTEGIEDHLLAAPLQVALKELIEAGKLSKTGQPDRPLYVEFTKGAVDTLLSVSEYVWNGRELAPLDDPWRKRIFHSHDQMAASGMRVLGVAFRIVAELPPPEPEHAERELAFIGMLGLIDPPRPEAKEAVGKCRTAGIRPVMITGDHPLTALHIAQELGIAGQQNARVVTGRELEALGPDSEQLIAMATEVPVFARVAPKHKLWIVRSLQRQAEVVAMTGDGVNDAPALKQAHIGVAMGITGTDVAKEAAEMVLLDDNFATIVNAVEEGRIVYDNIRKFVRYTLTSNAGEIWVMVLGPLVGMPLPLLPLQILWVNLVTDGLPGLALAVEPAERNVMQRPPYRTDESILSRGIGVDIAWVGLLMGLVSLLLGWWHWRIAPAEEDIWRTMVFTVLTFSQMGNALAVRSYRDSLLRIGLFSNLPLLGAILLTAVAQMAVIYLPALQNIFSTAALTAGQLITCVLLSTVVFAAVELRKWLTRTD